MEPCITGPVPAAVRANKPLIPSGVLGMLIFVLTELMFFFGMISAYLIVGSHAAHALAAILALGWAMTRLLRGTLEGPAFWTVQTFWYFVVAIWPILYFEVYL